MAESKVKTAQNNHKHRQEKEIDKIDEEIAELQTLEPSHPSSIYDKVYEQAESFATTSLGQYVIVRFDRILKTIEDTAKWSVPQAENSSPKSPTSNPLTRPLPWIPFLFLIIILRLTRVWLSVGALLIGNAPVTAADMVYFIQVRRRKLRALRVNGLKTKQRREQEAKNLCTHKISQTSFITKLRSIFSRAICQPGMQHFNRRILVVHQGIFEEEEKKKNNKNKETVPKPINIETDDDDDVGFEDDNDGHLVVQNMTVQEMLDKYAKESSADDSDFVPDEDESSEDDSLTDNSEEDLLLENGVHTDHNDGKDNNDEQSEHDEVLLVKENGGTFPNAVPMPIIEIKKEPLSDDNSGTEKSTQNGTKEHDSEAVAANNSNKIDTPKQNDTNKINVEKNMKQKSSPGHVSAAIANTRVLNNAAMAAPTNRRRHTPIDNDNSNQVNQVNEIESNPPTNVVVAANGYFEDDPTSLPTSQTINDPVFPDPSSNISANLLEANTSTSTTRPSLEKCDNTDTTLTPATSSEDLFYSPIGSPTDFNFLPPSILKQSTVNSSAIKAGNGAHSTPISDVETEEKDLPAKKHVTLQNQQKSEEAQQQNEQQHQDQHQQQQQQQKQKQHEDQQQQQKPKQNDEQLQQQQEKPKQHEEQLQNQQQKPKQHDEQQQQKLKQHDEQQQQPQKQQQQQQQQDEQQYQQQQNQKHSNQNNRFRGRNRR